MFDDLAHRIVHGTTTSLTAASTQIATLASPTDGTLFLIVHLLHLKQQIVAFDIEYSPTPEVHFSFPSVTDTFSELRDARGGLWNPAGWVRLVVGGGLLPRVVENMLDAKAELDGRLRGAINDFVASAAGGMTAAGEGAAEMAKKTRGVVEERAPELRRRIDEYVSDVRTRETLVAAVKDQVVAAYDAWVEGLAAAAEPGTPVTPGGRRRSRGKGKGREDEVWTADVFADWCGGVFFAPGPGAGVEEHAG